MMDDIVGEIHEIWAINFFVCAWDIIISKTLE